MAVQMIPGQIGIWLDQFLPDCKSLLASFGIELSGERLVYLGSKSEEDVVQGRLMFLVRDSLVSEFESKQFSFVELRTLMVATDWADERAMGDSAIAGYKLNGTVEMLFYKHFYLRNTRRHKEQQQPG